MVYDYLIVGSGLFGAVFAHEATKKGKKCLVIDKRSHLGGNIIVKRLKASTSTNMARTFFTLPTKKCGIMSTNLWSLTTISTPCCFLQRRSLQHAFQHEHLFKDV